MTKKITIKTISEASGVSTSIVSRILSGKAQQYRIAEKTRKKVMDIAKELNYRPNYFAKSLNSAQTFNIGVIFANSVGAFLGTIMEGVESRLRGTDYQMVVATCDNSPELERMELDRMFYRQVDGIIIYPSALTFDNNYPTEHFQQQKQNTPLVVIGRKIPIEANFVLFSDYEAGVEAAEIFLKSGCRRFGAANLPIKCSSDRDRIKGFTETLEKAGIKKKNIIVSNATADGMPSESELKLLDSIDALFAVNSSLLINYADTLKKNNLVSDLKCYALGVERFQHMLPFSGTFRPMPGREMGWQAAETLLHDIESDKHNLSIKRLAWPEAITIA
jgi:LacI family transcriptional regulator, galactose operon repressor